MKKPNPRRLFRERGPQPGHNYVAPVAYFVSTLALTPGTVVELATLHDDDCSLWKGGACDCEPVVKLMDEHRRDEAERN